MIFLSVSIYLSGFLAKSSAKSFGCEDISGWWYNNVGSEVQIDHRPDGTLQGSYYTAVSVSRRKIVRHDLVGTLPYNKPGSSFAFSVTWHNGNSTTVWTGQCQVCDGKETLETSWLLRSHVDSCIDIWKSTLIGKDLFFRKQNSEQSQQIGTFKQGLKKIPRLSPGNKCDLRGVWYNDVGSEIILNQTKYGIITGEYRTAVEREKGSAGTTHSLIYGSSYFGNPYSTFSLIVVWRGGKSVTGWVGQCHICGENKTVVLEMNWLLRTKVDNCNDVWKSTLYSTNSFTRHEQNPGPRKSSDIHTPNRDGEDYETDSNFSNKLVLSWLCHFVVLIPTVIKMI